VGKSVVACGYVRVRAPSDVTLVSRHKLSWSSTSWKGTRVRSWVLLKKAPDRESRTCSKEMHAFLETGWRLVRFCALHRFRVAEKLKKYPCILADWHRCWQIYCIYMLFSAILHMCL